MKHYSVVRLFAACFLIWQYSFVYAQKLFKIETNVLKTPQLTFLLSLLSKASPVKTSFAKASDGKLLPLSIKMQSTKDTQFYYCDNLSVFQEASPDKRRPVRIMIPYVVLS